MEIENLNFSQKQRLAYIVFKLIFCWLQSKAKVVTYFEKGLISVTREINLNKELCLKNMEYDSKEKKYFQTP